MNNQTYTRQLGFFDPSEHKNTALNIIGLGGIGSFLAIGAAKLGVPNIVIVDDDIVEQHNVPNQFHPLAEAEKVSTKVDSMADAMVAYGDVEPTRLQGRVGADSPAGWNPSGIVVSGVDSMAAREDIWKNGKIRLNPQVQLYIDARIAGQLMVIYTVNPTDMKDMKSYERTLHSDEDAVDAPCTERGVIDVGLMCGAVLTNMVRHAMNGTPPPKITMFNMGAPMPGTCDWLE